MDKLKMHTPNKADENFRKLAAMFPNAVTETINENGEVVRAIDKDVLMQEIACTVVDGNEERISSLGLTRRSPFFLPMHRSIRRCALFAKMKQFPLGQIVRENLIAALAAWTLIPPKTSISRETTSKC